MKKMQRHDWWWLGDIVGAACFAWGLADGLASLIADFSTMPWLAVGWLLAGGLLRAVSTYAARMSAAQAAQRASLITRSDLFGKLLGAPVPQPLSIGQSATVAIDYADRLEAYDDRFLPVRMAAVIGPLLVAAIVAFASPVSSVILLGTLLPFVLGMILAGSMARRSSDEQLTALALLSDLFVDRLRNIAIIRHFGAGDRLTRQVDSATQSVATRTMAVLRVAFLSSAVLEFFAALSVALVAVYCGFALLGILPFRVPETLEFREAMFALALAPEFYLPMRRLAAAYHEKQMGDSARKLVDPILAETSAPDIAPEPYQQLTVDNLAIRWPGCRVGPVDFQLGATGLVALVGPTGSGKTSILSAIAGQLGASTGTATAIDPQHIAWAAQRPLILPGTLRDNLSLARPDASDEEILAACHAVGLDMLVGQRAEGLDLLLDHRAAGLSGGERRRLGLARALLSQRPLILCDEPTADLDDDSALLIAALIAQISQRHAVIVATHDQRVIALAEQVVQL